MNTVQLDWVGVDQFKELVAKKKNPAIQFADVSSNYVVWFDEIRTRYQCCIVKVAEPVEGSDQKDFEDNYKASANQSATPTSVDGVQKVFSVPSIDDEACFCQGFKGTITAENDILEWTVDLPWVKVQGIRLWVLGAEKFDRIERLAVGYYHPVSGTWIEAGWWGRDIYLTGQAAELVTEDACCKSAPVPQGLKLRLKYARNNPESVVPVDCAGRFKLWRTAV